MGRKEKHKDLVGLIEKMEMWGDRMEGSMLTHWEGGGAWERVMVMDVAT